MGSKGIPDKNMRKLCGKTLIAHAGDCLSQLKWVDYRLLSTDSPLYAEEGLKHGLQAPFLRPPELSNDTASAVETIAHALIETELISGKYFDIIIIAEPTSPLRRPCDLEEATSQLVESRADSVVSVSKLDSKFHPSKILRVTDDNYLEFNQADGPSVTYRQTLSHYYYRNGACYILTRKCLLELRAIITENTKAFIIEREIVNIDELPELELAEFLARKEIQKKN